MLFLLFGIQSARSDGGLSSNQALDIFLKEPIEKSFLNWQSEFNTTSVRCKQQDRFDNNERDNLFRLIREENLFALKIGLQSYSCWDGGELEDFYRSVGIFFDSNPADFFTMVHMQSIVLVDLRFMVSLLPLEMTDDFDRQIELLDKRINSVKKFGNQSSTETSQSLLNILTESKAELERVKKEYETMPNQQRH